MLHHRASEFGRAVPLERENAGDADTSTGKQNTCCDAHCTEFSEEASEKSRRAAFYSLRDAWLRAIRRDRSLPAAALAVGPEIADYMNHRTGEAWPSVATLSGDLGYDERSIRRAVSALVSRGYLSVDYGRGKRTTRYRIAEAFAASVHNAVDNFVDNPVDDVCKPGGEIPLGGQSCPGGEDKVVRAGRTKLSPRTLEGTLEGTLKKNPPLDPPVPARAKPSPSVSEFRAAPIGAEFELVWSLYPKKVGKGAAEKAWKKARKRASFQEIAEPLAVFSENTAGTEIRFIPHLATWLNQRRWEDDQDHAINRPRTSDDDLRHLSTVSAEDDLARLFSAPQLRLGSIARPLSRAEERTAARMAGADML